MTMNTKKEKQELYNELNDSKRFLRNGMTSVKLYEKEINYLLEVLKPLIATTFE